MKLTILGSGTSQGVPMIGCECTVCQSPDPKDKRSRSSIYIESEVKILIDTPPDIRNQCISAKINQVDAVIITHAHADHIMGFDDLRRFCDMTHQKLPVYVSTSNFVRLNEIFYYTFDPNNTVKGYLHADYIPINNNSFTIGDLTFYPTPLPHGEITTTGLVIEKNGKKIIAYYNDCKEVPPPAMNLAQNIPILIIDGLRDTIHPTHLSIGEALEISKKLNAGKTYLTHLTHEKLHVQRSTEMPANCFVSYDGLQLEI
jgi:phosphoribosyl 1,2-cyclic phosphate phosphodiesterase